MTESAREQLPTATSTTHIIWDWNGTLLDDNDANLAALNQVCAQFGRPPVTLESWRAMFRRPLIPCYEELLGRRIDVAEWDRLNEVYADRYLELLPESPLAAGVPEVLRLWGQAGRTQSLLSMAGHEHVRELIIERELEAFFTRVDGRPPGAEHESKTEHLVRHVAEQGIDPAASVLIGDIDDDARAAEAAGARAILVTTGLMDRPRLEATGHPVVDSVAEAVAALDGAATGSGSRV